MRRITTSRGDFPFQQAAEIIKVLIERIYADKEFHPDSVPELPGLPVDGEGIDGFEDALSQMVSGSAGLASPLMAGHMDTAPHPSAVFADAVVSALNNNLLFRELSPFASRVEELLVSEFALALGLVNGWQGTFVSGGSLANLTALFAACGGYSGVSQRGKCELFVSACSHASVFKSAAVLGIASSSIHLINSDAEGRSDPQALGRALERSAASTKIVVAVMGSTVHGAVEDISALAAIARRFGAWLHVDAVYGGALAYSVDNRRWLKDLDLADSVVIGPQKWMFVPRLSAVVWIKGNNRYQESMRWVQSYSSTENTDHRGQWGIQGSRRADALTLWVVLRYLGTAAIGREVDRSIQLTKTFYRLLKDDPFLEPVHKPDLNLLCFWYRDTSGIDLDLMHTRLGRDSTPWVSLSQWDKQRVFRSVLLAPECQASQLQRLLTTLHPG